MNSSPLNYYRMQGHLIPYHENNKTCYITVLVMYDSFFKTFGQGGPDIWLALYFVNACVGKT